MENSRYNATTTGRILVAYVFNHMEFNRRIAAGDPYEQVYEDLRNKDAITFMPVAKGRHYIYQYEVDGVTYTRASEQTSIRKDIYIELNSKSQHPYIIYYNTENPFDSRLGGAYDQAPTAAGDSTMSLIFAIISFLTCFLIIPGIVFGILAIVKGVKALKGNMANTLMPIMGIVWGGVGILGSLTMGVFILVGILFGLFGVFA